MKNHFFPLETFDLDISSLWNSPNGPRWENNLASLLQKSHDSLHSKFQSGNVGFYDWPIRIQDREKENIRQISQRLKKNFERVLIFGIGGSHLGPAAVLQALRSPKEEDSFPIRWLSNIDPSSIRQAEYYVKEHRTAFIVISKSGGTTETLSGFFHFSQNLDPKGVIIITDPEKGFLRSLSRQQGWDALEVPPNIGGRFSVLSAAGLLPMELAGISLDEILDGAKSMRAALDTSSAVDNPAYLLALAFYLWDTQHGHSVQYLMPYWNNLKLVADWFVQLWGESLGKKKLDNPETAVGFTPVAALGTTDQHSLLQLFKEGPNNKVVGFVDVPTSCAPILVGSPPFNPDKYRFLMEHSFDEISHFASLATEKSLNNAQVPTYRISIPRINARMLGALLFFFETSCAFAGELYKVNAFNQPGVEEAKKLLRESL